MTQVGSSVPSRGKWYVFFCGVCMGAADLVPGISGGTIAFIMGFYPQLLDSLKTINGSSLCLLLKGQWRLFAQAIAWKFLLPLLAGIVLSLIVLSSFLHCLLGHEVYRIYLYSVFSGLILASFVFCIRQLEAWRARHFIGLICGVAVAYLFTEKFNAPNSEGQYAIKLYVNQGHVPVSNYNSADQMLTHLSRVTLGAMLAKEIINSDTPIYSLQGELVGKAADLAILRCGYKVDPWMGLCGALAICALLLPGISGSYILTLLGAYPLVIHALVDLTEGLQRFSLDKDASVVLLNLGIGILLGAATFSRGVSWLLKQYPDATIAILAGFMIGALRSVWPFWSYEYMLLPLKLHKGPQLLVMNPVWPSIFSPVFVISLFYALAGFGLVFFAEYFANSPYAKKQNEEARSV